MLASKDLGDDAEPDNALRYTLRRRVEDPRSAVKFYARFGLGDAGGNFRRDPRHRGLQGYSDRRRTRAGAQQSFRQGDDIGKEGREQRRQRVSDIV